MSATVPMRRRTVRAAFATGVVAVVAAAVLGVLAVDAVWIALVAAAGILGLAILLRNPVMLPVLAVPATFVQVRVGGALSVSDLVLAAATLVALLSTLGRGAKPLQPLLWAGTVYLAMAVPTLILNPYSANLVEWAHEVMLVLGSMLVGWVIGRSGRARLALTFYAVVCVAFGVAAAVVTVAGYLQSGRFDPAYVLTLQKNTTGGMLAVSGVLAFARPLWLRWSRRWAWTVLVVSIAGILATQSRQGLIALVVGGLVVGLRTRPQTGRRATAVWFAAVPAFAAIGIVVAQQFQSGDRFNSLFQRVNWYQQSLDVWAQSPVFGVGMRWWYTDRFGAAFESFQPPNAELEVLTETGVFGLIGFLLMFAAAGWLLWRLDPIYGTVGVAVVAARLAQAQFDLYWVAGQASLLWIVAGICYGVRAHDQVQIARGEAPSWLGEALGGTRPALPEVAPR